MFLEDLFDQQLLIDADWGHTLKWPCGHAAVLLDIEHDLDHFHWCPVCDGRTLPECDAEYLDIHRWRNAWA